MSLEPLMQDLADRLGVTHLTPDEQGRYTLSFDDRIEVEVGLLDRSTVLFESEVGREPEDEWEATSWFERVLSRSICLLQRGEETICLDPDTGRILLTRMVQLPSLSGSRMEEILEQFTNQAEEWIAFLNENDHSTGSPTTLVPMLMP